MKIHCFLVISGSVLLNCAAPFPSANAMVEVCVLGFVSSIFHQPERLCSGRNCLGAQFLPPHSLPSPPGAVAKVLLIFLLFACPCTLHQYYSSLACFYSCIFCWFQSVTHFPSYLRRRHFTAGHH